MQVSPPAVRKDGPLQMLITNLDYDEHKGRIAIGRVTSGKISRAEGVVFGRPGTLFLLAYPLGDASMPSASSRCGSPVVCEAECLLCTGLESLGR